MGKNILKSTAILGILTVGFTGSVFGWDSSSVSGYISRDTNIYPAKEDIDIRITDEFVRNFPQDIKGNLTEIIKYYLGSASKIKKEVVSEDRLETSL